MYFSYIKWVNYYSHVNKIVTFFLYTKNFRFIFGSSESCNCRPPGKNQNPLNDLFMQNKTIVLELFDLWSITCIYMQMLVSTLSGPWDALFGGGNLPAFVVGAVMAAVSAIMAIVLLPTPKPADVAKASSLPPGGGFH